VCRMLSFFLAILLKLQLGCTFCNTYIRTIVSTAAFGTLQPDILSFALLLSHQIIPPGGPTCSKYGRFISYECPGSLADRGNICIVSSRDLTTSHRCSRDNLRYHASSDGSTAFTNSKA